MIKSRRLRWAGRVASMSDGRSCFKMLADKPTRIIPVGMSRSRWEDNITMNLKEISINMRNLVDSVQDRDYWISIAKAKLNLRVS